MVTVLILCSATGACAAHEAICEISLGFRIVELFDRSLCDEICIDHFLPDFLADKSILFAVGGAVVVELNVELAKVRHVGFPHIRNELYLAPTFLAGSDHDGGAVRVVSTEITAFMPPQLLESHPDIGLDVLHKVANMDVPIGIWEGGGNENSTL